MSHRDVSDPCGKGTGFLEEDSSLAEDCFGLSGGADLLRGLSDIGREYRASLELVRHCRNDFGRIGSAADQRREMLCKALLARHYAAAAGVDPDERTAIRVRLWPTNAFGRRGRLGRALSMIAICVKSIELRSARGDIAKAAG